MKVFGRVLIILTVFFMAAGLMLIAVNSNGANAPDFNDVPRFNRDGTNVELRPEHGEERERDFGGVGLFFGPIKNITVIGVLVAAIVLPKNAAKRKKRTKILSADNAD